MALVNVLSGNKQRGLWIQRHLKNGGKKTAGQSGNIFFLLQLQRLVVYSQNSVKYFGIFHTVQVLAAELLLARSSHHYKHEYSIAVQYICSSLSPV